MINENDSMMYMNVYSKKYWCLYKHVNQHMEEFKIQLREAGVESNGPFIYSIGKILEDGFIGLELYQPVKEYREVRDKDIKFSSYFYIDNMLSSVVLDNFEFMEWTYSELMQYIWDNKLKSCSNIFNEIHDSADGKYIIVKVAV